jgi:hypothetical protein
MGKGIGSVIKLRSLTKSSLGKLDLANPSIMLALSHHKQALFLKRTQQTAEVGRIEPQPAPEFPNFRPLFCYLPQEPRFAKRMVSTQKVIVEYTNVLCYRPIETSDLFNQWYFHENLQLA